MESEQRIDIVARHIFKRLLLTMESQQTDIRKNQDIDCLHDFRVALRRTRTLLSQLKGIFPQATIRRFKREFDWLADTSGPARDLDVYLFSFGKLRSYLPKKKQEDLFSFLEYLQRLRQKEYHAVIKALESRRYQKDMHDWKKIINKTVAKKARSTAPIKLVANASIWRSYKKALKKAVEIDSASAESSLHELRKACRKLRYLLEFFQQSYPAEKIRVLVDNLKEIQDNLGEIQDLRVQRHYLNGFISSPDQHSEANVAARKSMHILIRKLEQRGNRIRKKFNIRFARFNSPENYKLYKMLFAP